ncbi:MAG: hypothetical protein WCI55_07805 [Armatimonadota bacterium]
MNTPDYMNRGLRATDIFIASGIYFGGRGALTVFHSFFSVLPNRSFSLLVGLASLGFGIVLFKLGVHLGSKSLYRTGSKQDWDNCQKRIFENAKRVEKNHQPSVVIPSKVQPNQDVDIQYHW